MPKNYTKVSSTPVGTLPNQVSGSFTFKETYSDSNDSNSRNINVSNYDTYEQQNVVLNLINQPDMHNYANIPFRIDTKSDTLYMNEIFQSEPNHCERNTVSGNFIPSQDTVKYSSNSSWLPGETPIQKCANACSLSNSLKLPEFKSNCIGFEYNPTDGSCFGYALPSNNFALPPLNNIVNQRPCQRKKYFNSNDYSVSYLIPSSANVKTIEKQKYCECGFMR